MATGDGLYYWDAASFKVPDDAFATPDTILVASTDEPDDVVECYDFDPGATQEYIYLTGRMPKTYVGTTGVTLTIEWTAEATTGDVKWDAAFKLFGDSSPLLTTVYAAVNTVTTGTDGTARDTNTSVITFTDGADMASVTAGDKFHILITRDSADAGDTMNSNDAELISVTLKET